MEIIKVMVELIMLVYKIIEAIIRGLVQSSIEIAAYSLGGVGAILFTFLVIRYGVCEESSCLSEKSLSNLAVVTGCAFALVAAYTAFKNFL